MSDDLVRYIESQLTEKGWTVKKAKKKRLLPKAVKDRYDWVSADVLDAVCRIDEAVSSDEKRWLVTCLDHRGESESAFAADEFERMSIEAAEGDEELEREVTSFWNDHFCLAIGVGDGYEHFSLSREGVVVNGREPEFEEVDDLASDFRAFIRAIASAGS